MIIDARQMSLNAVSTVAATAESDVFIVKCNITDIAGDTYDTDYCSRPDDGFGLNPTLRQWLAGNLSFPVQPYVPPTAEETRASMPAITARQLRLGLLNSGVSPTQVTAAIDGIPAETDKEKARIEWEYAPTFSRSHHLIGAIGSLFDLTDAQIDAMWMVALDL